VTQPGDVRIRRALLSVSDKTSVVDAVVEMIDALLELVATALQLVLRIGRRMLLHAQISCAGSRRSVRCSLARAL